VELSNVTAILGGEEVLHKKISNRMDLIELSQKGIPKDALVNLAKYFSFTTRQMAQLLPVTARTIRRYTEKNTLIVLFLNRSCTSLLLLLEGLKSLERRPDSFHG
jgi:hypothetical protein